MRKILIISVLLLVTLICRALPSSFEAQRGVIPGGYDFWVHTPDDYEPKGHRFPLIIFLHGASLCGNNLDRVLRYGTLDAIEKGKHIPMLVAAPQNPGGAWNPKKLNDLLEWMKAHYQVDTTRVYVLGMSLGGYGTLDFAAAYPEKIAAAMALCGGCSRQDVQPLGRVPLWIMHGTADKAVSVQESKRVVAALEQSGNDHLLRFDWFVGGSHGYLARVFYLQKTYDWLIAHSLLDRPREVSKMFDITKDDIASTYQELKIDASMYEKD
jgi:predicted peptidase